MKTRDQFGQYFEQFNKTGYGAEVGVQNGFNSRKILLGYSGKLLLIDNWNDNLALKTTVLHLVHYRDRVIYIPLDTLLAANLIPNDSLDFVYIDAGHSYIEVKQDFETYYPKVRSGGIISGHDYGLNDCIGVKMFIDEYIFNNPEIDIKFTTDDIYEGMEYQSWYFVKP